MLELIIIINFLILIIYTLFLYKHNKIKIYKINEFKGGHFIDRKIRDTTIFPIINKTAIELHDYMHWVFQYGEVKEDVNNVLKNEVKERLNANNLYNKVLNNSYITNKTRIAIRKKRKKNKQIMRNIISDII